jgi:hypothetical protein
VMAHQARNVRIVFHYEDAGFHANIVTKGVEST